MTGNTSTLVIQFLFLAAIILAPWFYRRSKSLGLSRWGLKEQVTRTHASLRQVEIGSPEFFPCILSAAYDACGSKRVGEFYGTSTANCRRADLFFPKAGFKRILSRAKPGTPPCKSGQLEKDLGLEASSLRHAARLIIFEIMRFLLRWFKGAGD